MGQYQYKNKSYNSEIPNNKQVPKKGKKYGNQNLGIAEWTTKQRP